MTKAQLMQTLWNKICICKEMILMTDHVHTWSGDTSWFQVVAERMQRDATASQRRGQSSCHLLCRQAEAHWLKHSHSPLMPCLAVMILHGVWMPAWLGQNTSRVQILCVQQSKNLTWLICVDRQPLSMHNTAGQFDFCFAQNSCHSGGGHRSHQGRNSGKSSADMTPQHLHPYWWDGPRQSESTLVEESPRSKCQIWHTSWVPKNK